MVITKGQRFYSWPRRHTAYSLGWVREGRGPQQGCTSFLQPKRKPSHAQLRRQWGLHTHPHKLWISRPLKDALTIRILCLGTASTFCLPASGMFLLLLSSYAYSFPGLENYCVLGFSPQCFNAGSVPLTWPDGQSCPSPRQSVSRFTQRVQYWNREPCLMIPSWVNTLHCSSFKKSHLISKIPAPLHSSGLCPLLPGSCKMGHAFLGWPWIAGTRESAKQSLITDLGFCF